jgi:glycosyltransferase involved in cell wall biosynthesis
LSRSRARRVRVTVIIPTFNWSTVLPYSIASVLEQSWQDFELLVIGDGCTDDSELVVGQLATSDERIRWMSLAATGHQAGPNNEGLRCSRGELIAYLGHDDLWLPRHLERLVGVIDAGATFARSTILLVNPGHAPFVFPSAGQDQVWVPPTSMMVKADALREVGGWRFPTQTGNLDPESDLTMRLAQRFGPPVLQPIVSAIKLPASYRRNVYRTRPCHEQAHWLERIRGADDPEAMVLSACAEATEPLTGESDPVALLAPVMSPSVGAAERHRVLRSHKGLEDGPTRADM